MKGDNNENTGWRKRKYLLIFKSEELPQCAVTQFGERDTLVPILLRW